MNAAIATIFGGSGFLGVRIVQRLAGESWRPRIAARHPEPAGADGIQADVRDEGSVSRAVEGAGAVVNAVGLYVEQGAETFEAVHVEGAGRVARACAQAGVTRLVHISGIGADPGSESSYVRARAAGEAAVQDALPSATILRPSVLFGPGDSFFTTLAGIARLSPVFPLFGDGTARLQPVFVDDVAQAVTRALADPAAQGRVYELGGPKAYPYRELIELVLERTGRRRMLLPVPLPVWSALATVVAVLPNPPITRDQIALVRRDNVVGAGALGLADFGIEPTPVEAVLPSYIG